MTAPADPPIDHNELKRLKYRACHRGFKEADIILGNFAERELEALGAEQTAEFARLLDEPDQDIYDWIMGRSAEPAQFKGGVLDLIRASASAGRLAP
ncbi:MAG: FAD assembly factor SdhE [Caulobacteraceae bacterium]